MILLQQNYPSGAIIGTDYGIYIELFEQNALVSYGIQWRNPMYERLLDKKKSTL